ncbi:MAG: hypothetical protein QXZ31_06365 [Thermofilaceae archaeon]
MDGVEPSEALRLARMIVSGKVPSDYDELYAALLELRVLFDKPPSWYTRAVARVLLGIREVGERHWLVPGLPGDAYPLYNVRSTGEGRYVCDCYGHLYGFTRERSICTHVASVMLTRRWAEIRRVLGRDTGEPSGGRSDAVADQRDCHYD